MEKLKRKYAEVILKFCLNVRKDKPLFITYDIEIKDFVRTVVNVAYEIGITDIYLEGIDSNLKHDALKYLSLEKCKKTPYWNKEKWNEYAKKEAAFLMLSSENPNLMDDVDLQKLKKLIRYSQKTRKVFDDARAKAQLLWTIAAVPNYTWAKEIYKDSKDPVNDLWKEIFSICMIDKKDPIKLWQKKLNKLNKTKDKLNKYRFKKLQYKNSLGTDFTVELPDKHLWLSGFEKTNKGRVYLPNFPTEEVFTSPDFKSAEGIVYSSKPLSYQGNIIDKFSITFKGGKAISWSAKVGSKALDELVSNCKNSNYLGEIALVEHKSAISKSNLIFFETLFDENASCHLALGDSFPECYENGNKIDKKELLKLGLNDCDSHTDFMIGTNDLEIIGYTKDDKQIKIFENGNFTKEFK